MKKEKIYIGICQEVDYKKKGFPLITTVKVFKASSVGEAEQIIGKGDHYSEAVIESKVFDKLLSKIIKDVNKL